MSDIEKYDVIIIGAGAAGLMCAIEAGKRGRNVWLIDHAKKPAEKVRISGGGRCNFTNVLTAPKNFLSDNEHFCKSAFKQYTQADFIALVEKHGIPHHEKKLGQLFCDTTAQDIIDMLLKECAEAGVLIDMETSVDRVSKTDDGYQIDTTAYEESQTSSCTSLVIATGGLSIPKMGATKFGYDIARQFGLDIVKTTPALVPLTFQTTLLERCKALTGLSVEASVTCGKTTFSEGLLFTHRGLSGPSILQISSYWNEGNEIIVDMAPGVNILAFLKKRRGKQPKQDIQNAIADHIPKRLAVSICEDLGMEGNIADLSDKKLITISKAINEWRIKPAGSEGYRTAEVTLGGVNTDELSSKTMETKKQPGLFFIGEVVDVTGHLGGHNFQWAWSSGYVAGQNT